MKIAFAHKADEPEYTEVLLTEVEERIPAATEWARANGYVVRVADVDLSVVPDFTKTLERKAHGSPPIGRGGPTEHYSDNSLA